MVDITEFLALKGLSLDLKVVREWAEPDPAFVAYALRHHREFDMQHLRCAMQMLQAVNSDTVRELFLQYSDHPVTGCRAMARGSLELHRERGWTSEAPAAS